MSEVIEKEIARLYLGPRHDRTLPVPSDNQGIIVPAVDGGAYVYDRTEFRDKEGRPVYACAGAEHTSIRGEIMAVDPYTGLPRGEILVLVKLDIRDRFDLFHSPGADDRLRGKPIRLVLLTDPPDKPFHEAADESWRDRAPLL